MALGLDVGCLVQPFRIVLNTTVAIAIPSPVVISIITVAISVAGPVLGIPVAPALGLLDALPLGHGSIIVAARRAIPEPRVGLAPA